MDWVQSEHGGKQAAARRSAAYSSYNKKNEEGVEHMKKNIGKMMHARMQTSQLTAQHVREPDHGLPGSFIGGAECPPDRIQRETRPYMGIFQYVLIVVKVDKIIAGNLPVYAENCCCQQQANDNFLAECNQKIVHEICLLQK
jgi:hypothetical protein